MIDKTMTSVCLTAIDAIFILLLRELLHFVHLFLHLLAVFDP